MQYHDATALFQRGLDCLRDAQYGAALVAFTRAIESDPLFVPARVERGFLLLGGDDKESASQDFERAIEIDPTCGPAYRGRGWLRYHARDFEAALHDAYQGLECDLSDPTPYEFLIGAAYRVLKDYSQAMGAYTRIVERDPKNVEAHYHRAQVHLETAAQEAALADLTQALQLRPGWPPALQTRSILYLQVNRPKLALTDLNAILEQYPDAAAAYYWRSQAYARLHRMRLSYLDFVQAGLLDPDLRENHAGRWVLAHPMRLLLAIIAAIAFGLFALLILTPPDLTPRNHTAVNGTFSSLEPWDGNGLAINLAQNSQRFVISTGDLPLFDLQGFTHDVRPGDQVTLSVITRAYEERERSSFLVVFQVRAAGRNYIDLDRLIAGRQHEANTLFPLGTVISVAVAVFAILPATRSPWPRSPRNTNCTSHDEQPDIVTRDSVSG